MRTLAALVFMYASITAQSIEDAGPHLVGWQDVSFASPSGGAIDARLYYPALSAGEDTPPDSISGPYPLVALLHRYVGTASDYDELSTHVASHGFFIASIDTETGFNATMQQQAQDSADMLNWVSSESSTPTSQFAGMVANGPWGAIGHSMGGGALFYLIEDEPNVRVLVAFEPYRGNILGGYVGSVANVENFTGTLFAVGGSVDFVTPPAAHSLAYYNAAVSSPRTFHTLVEGMGHQGPTDEPVANDPYPPAAQIALHRRFAAGFLRAELLGEEALYFELLDEGVASEPLDQVTRTTDPVLWAAPSSLAPATVSPGIAATAGDSVWIAVSLATASVPTPFGILGIDPGLGLIFEKSTLSEAGHGAFPTAVPPTLSGLTLHFQGLALGADHAALTGVRSTLAP